MKATLSNKLAIFDMVANLNVSLCYEFATLSDQFRRGLFLNIAFTTE
jgi:hypothetical protein